jgi:hypothetical protein
MQIKYLNLWYIQENEKVHIMRNSWYNVYSLILRKIL